MGKKYSNFSIGKYTYGDPIILFDNEGAKLTIGNFCSIAGGVKIFLGGEHRTDWITTFPFNIFWEDAQSIDGHPKPKGDVIIGNDVWIGAEAVVLSGVTIGDGAVVGARSVVAKNIEPYAIYAGNPAKFIKKRFSDEIIKDFLDLKWWDLDDDLIAELTPYLLSSETSRFIKKVKDIKNNAI